MEPVQPFLPELRQAVLCLLVRFLAFGMRLAVEFVGIADKFLLKGLRKEVLMGQWQMLADNLFFGESGTGVALADTCVAWVALPAHNLSSYNAVADVRLRSEALYSRGITTEDADVVEHGGLSDELPVETKFWMGVAYLYGTLHHQCAVSDENPSELVVLRVVLVNY